MFKKNYLNNNQIFLNNGSTLLIKSTKKKKMIENLLDCTNLKYLNTLKNPNLNKIIKETSLNNFLKKFKN